MDPRRRHLPALDGLRGLAVLLVLLAHGSNVGLFVVPGLDLRGVGRHGVLLFFLLSAYLLTRQLLGLSGERARRPGTWLRYAARRLLRVYPAYLAVLVLYVIADGWSFVDVGRHLALREARFHLWTIPVELWSYALPPAVLLAHVALGRRPGRTAVAVVAAVVGSGLVWPPDYRLSLAPFAPIFLCGSAVACLDLWLEGRDARGSAAVPNPAGDAPAASAPSAVEARALGLVGWLGVLGLVTLVPSVASLALGERVDHRAFHLHFWAYELAGSALLLAVVRGAGGLGALLRPAPLRFLGGVSYSLYLLHALVLERVLRHTPAWPDPLPGVAFLVMSISLAWAMARLVERPFQRALR